LKMQHQGQKKLRSDFHYLWERLDTAREQHLITPDGHKFTASACRTVRGSHKGQEFIRVKQANQEYARIYSCCWGHTTNCYDTRIGGYSDGLDSWAESLMQKPNDEVIRSFDMLLNSNELDYDQAVSRLPEEPGVYLIYDRKQKKHIYVGRTKNIRKRIQQHRHYQSENARLYGQQVQRGLITEGTCVNSMEAQQYLSLNCTVKHLIIPDDKRQKYPWMRRSLLEHYAISVIEPEYNIACEFEH